jgi:hypothetical protein
MNQENNIKEQFNYNIDDYTPPTQEEIEEYHRKKIQEQEERINRIIELECVKCNRKFKTTVEEYINSYDTGNIIIHCCKDI